MRRLDDLLLMKEFNVAVFDHRILEKHLQAALTLPTAGMDHDHERLEFLGKSSAQLLWSNNLRQGDAYLKYASSVYLYSLQSQQSEGVMHILRQSLISNACLLKNAIQSGLPPFIQGRSFLAKAWMPPGFKNVDHKNGATEPKIEVANKGTATKQKIVGAEPPDYNSPSISSKRRARRSNISEDLQQIPDKV